MWKWNLCGKIQINESKKTNFNILTLREASIWWKFMNFKHLECCRIRILEKEALED